ncbi:MAG: PspC domain-containing protein [Bacteroidota bacterium]
MNKTVAANIGGFVFNVEEQAYETLNAYLRAVRKSLGNDESADEIMHDVELRMAELLKDILFKEKREVIGDADVQYIMEIMGAPEVYGDESSGTSREKEENKSSAQNESGDKQIFRDPDNRKLGGVCSGLASYFGWDPVLLRVFFVILFFFGGGGFLIYIILWIIIPEAKTTADKMKMRGEKIDVEGIKSRFKDFKKDVENLATPSGKKKMRDGARQVAGYFDGTVRSIGQVVGRAVGIVLLVVALILMVVFIRALFTSDLLLAVTDEGVHSFNYNDLGAAFFGSATQTNLVFISIMVLLMVPLAEIILWGIRLVFNRKFSSKPLNITLGVMASAAFITLAIIATMTAADFSKDKELSYSFPVSGYNGDTIYVEVNHDPYFSDHFENNNDDYMELVKLEDKSIIYGYPQLDITRATGKEFVVNITRSACGSSQGEAIKRTENIQFNMQQVDSLLKFDPWYLVPKTDLLRGQQVFINLQVPDGKVVYLGKGTKRIIYDIQNKYDILDRHMEGHYWVMKPDGLQETFR